MSYTTSYKKNYIYAGILAVLSVLLYAEVFQFLQTARAEAEKIRTTKAVELDTQNVRATLVKSLTASASDRDLLDAHFVHKDGVVDFINGLEDMGMTTRVTASISSLGESWQDSGGGTLSLSLHVAGTFADIYRYLALLEEVPQKLILDDITLTAGESGPAPATRKAIGPHTIIWSGDIRATVLHYIK